MPEPVRQSPRFWSQFFRRLSFRVVGVSTLLVALALLAVSFIIVDLYRSAIERRFDALLSAHLFSLVAGTSVSAANQLIGVPQIGDQRYRQPNTGWVWDVVPASKAVTGRLASPFLAGELIAPSTAEVPFDAAFERRYDLKDQEGRTLRVLETEVQLGADTIIARYRVAGNLAEVADETAQFFRQLFGFLSVVGFMMISINAAAIILGLRPLVRARDELGKVRAGEADGLQGPFPFEIEPLANEINALIESNKRIVDRARVQVGDLAHALKTPLAVIINEAGAEKTSASKTIFAQAGMMRGQIDHYLQRARIAAQTGTVAYRTEVKPVLEKMRRVFTKLNPDKTFDFKAPFNQIWFAGEAQDLEEIIGNLLENASKWAKQYVTLTLSERSSAHGKLQMFEFLIEDDGPGIPEDKRDEAVARGKRLDESKPGTGLGLSIVAELVREYHGHLTLENSVHGGLKVVVALPVVPE
jgi:signal transduction histidine kinase